MFNLEKHIKHIKKIKPNEQGFNYDPSRWEDLKSEWKSSIREFENMLVTRKIVINSFKEHFENKCDYFKPYLLTMIWGYANAGYGNYRVKTQMRNPEQIKKAFDKLKSGNLEEAFEELISIKGLGISFASKLLYFGGRARIKEYPLIFDRRVAGALVKLYVPKSIEGIFEISPSSKFEEYQNYISFLHTLAKKNHVEAEQIEQFLYEQKF